jgi:hypothetical protein
MEKVPEKEATPNILAQHPETRRVSKYDPIAPVVVSAPNPTTPRHVDPKQEHRILEAKVTEYTPFIDRNIGVSISHIRSKPETDPKALLSVYEAPTAIDPYVRLQDTQNAITQRHCLPLLPEVCAQTQKIAATCRKLTRTAHVFQNHFQVGNNKASNVSASPVVEALISASSTLVSDITVTSATSGDSVHQQLCSDNPSSLLSSSATSVALSNKISLQNTLETPIGDLHATSGSSCDYISSISDSAFATIPATLDLHLEQSFSSSDSNKHAFFSDVCDIYDSAISKSNSATPILTSTVSNHRDICDSDLKFELNLATSDIAVIFNHTEALQNLSDICDPFRNIPTLDLRLSPYKPNSRYQQDRKANIIVVLHPLIYAMSLFSLVSTLLSVTFSKGAQPQRHHIFGSSLWSHFVEIWSHLCSIIRYSCDWTTPYIFALSGQRMSLLWLNVIGLVVVWSLFGHSASGLHNSFSATQI